jgi:hypothetical protein
VDDDPRPGGRSAGLGDDGFDPFAPVEASPRFATPLAVVAILLGVLAAVAGLAPIAGPVGMGVGLVAHVKGSRLGMPATGVAAVGMIVGMALSMYLR